MTETNDTKTATPVAQDSQDALQDGGTPAKVESPPVKESDPGPSVDAQDPWDALTGKSTKWTGPSPEALDAALKAAGAEDASQDDAPIEETPEETPEAETAGAPQEPARDLWGDIDPEKLLQELDSEAKRVQTQAVAKKQPIREETKQEPKQPTAQAMALKPWDGKQSPAQWLASNGIRDRDQLQAFFDAFTGDALSGFQRAQEPQPIDEAALETRVAERVQQELARRMEYQRHQREQEELQRRGWQEGEARVRELLKDGTLLGRPSLIAKMPHLHREVVAFQVDAWRKTGRELSTAEAASIVEKEFRRQWPDIARAVDTEWKASRASKAPADEMTKVPVNGTAKGASAARKEPIKEQPRPAPKPEFKPDTPDFWESFGPTRKQIEERRLQETKRSLGIPLVDKKPVRR